MSVDREVRKCGASRGVKQLRADCQIGLSIVGAAVMRVPSPPAAASDLSPTDRGSSRG